MERVEEQGFNEYDLIKLRKLTENRIVLSKHQDVMLHERMLQSFQSSLSMPNADKFDQTTIKNLKIKAKM